MSQTDNDTAPLDNSPVDTDESDSPDTLENAPVNDGETLQSELDAAHRRAEEMSEAFLRARADFANYKRRNEEERETLRTVMNTDLLTRLLPVVDNLSAPCMRRPGHRTTTS
jgi:molecular chaperone GrpE